LGKREVNSRAYVSRFNFSGTDQQKRVGQLSGGERNRVHLAKMLKTGANVLLLDEPTNDLDVNTMRALEEAWKISRAAPSSSATTAGFLIESPRTFWRLKATRKSNFSTAIIPNTKPTKTSSWALTPTSRTELNIAV
jgi:hypothetical protein